MGEETGRIVNIHLKMGQYCSCCLATHTTSSFQLLSDIHLEFKKPGRFCRKFPIPQRKAPYLALLGDIGTMTDSGDSLALFVKKCCDVFDQVWFVIGNHEGYGGSFEGAVEFLTNLEVELAPKFVLFNRKVLDVPGGNVRVLGCTLWTRIPEQFKTLVSTQLNDFYQMSDMTMEKYCELHTRDVTWLQEQCAVATSLKKEIVILTHHAPTSVSSFPVERETMESTWGVGCTELKEEFNTELFPTLKCWAFGHTHWNMDEVQHAEGRVGGKGVRFVTNQVGYPQDSYKQYSGWRDAYPLKVIEL